MKGLGILATKVIAEVLRRSASVAFQAALHSSIIPMLFWNALTKGIVLTVRCVNAWEKGSLGRRSPVLGRCGVDVTLHIFVCSHQVLQLTPSGLLEKEGGVHSLLFLQQNLEEVVAQIVKVIESSVAVLVADSGASWVTFLFFSDPRSEFASLRCALTTSIRRKQF